jgi:hypothetical protein
MWHNAWCVSKNIGDVVINSAKSDDGRRDYDAERLPRNKAGLQPRKTISNANWSPKALNVNTRSATPRSCR